MPDVADQHQGAAPAAALLDQSGDEAVQRAPGDRSAGAAVDAAHVGMARAQAGDVDAHAAAAGHDLHHLRQRVDDAVAGIARRRDDVAVVEGELLVRARGGEDAAAGHEAPVGQQPAEALLPGRPLRVRLHGGDAARHARHHLLGRRLQRLVHGVRRARQLGAVAKADRHVVVGDRAYRANLALAGGGVGADHHQVAGGERRLARVLQRVAVQEDLLAQVGERSEPHSRSELPARGGGKRRLSAVVVVSHVSRSLLLVLFYTEAGSRVSPSRRSISVRKAPASVKRP